MCFSTFESVDQEYLQKKVFPKFTDACIEALEDEKFYGTTNHYFDAKFREDEICPDALVQSFVQKAQNTWDNTTKTRRSAADPKYRMLNMPELEKCLLEAKKEIAEKEVHTDLTETQKKRVFAATKAHFDVEKKTLVDILLKKTKDILIRGHTDWINLHFLRSGAISTAAKEDENICKLRKIS